MQRYSKIASKLMIYHKHSFKLNYEFTDLCFILSIETCRNRAFQLVSRAYDSISWKDLAAIVGLSVDDAIQGIVNSNSVAS